MKWDDHKGRPYSGNVGEVAGALTGFPTTGQHPRPDANALLSQLFGEETMQRTLSVLAIGVCANALMSLSAVAQAAPEVTLTRLDCGTSNPPTDVGLRFSDTYAYNGVKVQLVFSCYLIKHG